MKGSIATAKKHMRMALKLRARRLRRTGGRETKASRKVYKALRSKTRDMKKKKKKRHG